MDKAETDGIRGSGDLESLDLQMHLKMQDYMFEMINQYQYGHA